MHAVINYMLINFHFILAGCFPIDYFPFFFQNSVDGRPMINST